MADIFRTGIQESSTAAFLRRKRREKLMGLAKASIGQSLDPPAPAGRGDTDVGFIKDKSGYSYIDQAGKLATSKTKPTISPTPAPRPMSMAEQYRVDNEKLVNNFYEDLAGKLSQARGAPPSPRLFASSRESYMAKQDWTRQQNAVMLELGAKREEQLLEVRQNALQIGMQMQKEMMRARASAEIKPTFNMIEKDYKEVLGVALSEPWVIGEKKAFRGMQGEGFWQRGKSLSGAAIPATRKWERANMPLQIDRSSIPANVPDEYVAVIQAGLDLMNGLDYENVPQSELVQRATEYERIRNRYMQMMQTQQNAPLEIPDDAAQYLEAGRY